jgi:hypothetical protein
MRKASHARPPCQPATANGEGTRHHRRQDNDGNDDGNNTNYQKTHLDRA